MGFRFSSFVLVEAGLGTYSAGYANPTKKSSEKNHVKSWCGGFLRIFTVAFDRSF